MVYGNGFFEEGKNKRTSKRILLKVLEAQCRWCQSIHLPLTGGNPKRPIQESVREERPNLLPKGKFASDKNLSIIQLHLSRVTWSSLTNKTYYLATLVIRNIFVLCSLYSHKTPKLWPRVGTLTCKGVVRCYSIQTLSVVIVSGTCENLETMGGIICPFKENKEKRFNWCPFVCTPTPN